MIRKETYAVDRILALLGTSEFAILDGDRVKVSSLRLLNFKVHGIVCVGCGIRGEYFIKEKHHVSDVSYHLNLYGRDKDGEEVLMTRDHIIPGSKGGPNILSNLQTMCMDCNVLKDNKILTF
jgi:5-methylcytosine-specific restriction endonuclease McrA